MSHYELAIRLWSAVAAAGLLVPLLAVLANETRKAIECVRASAVESVPSHPAPSTPSHHGF